MRIRQQVKSSNLVTSTLLSSPNSPPQPSSNKDIGSMSRRRNRHSSDHNCFNLSPLSGGVCDDDDTRLPTSTYVKPNSNGHYLKSDQMSTTVKSDVTCPSPLALLAKTCQNIGQMMENDASMTVAITTSSTSSNSTTSSTNRLQSQTFISTNSASISHSSSNAVTSNPSSFSSGKSTSRAKNGSPTTSSTSTSSSQVNRSSNWNQTSLTRRGPTSSSKSHRHQQNSNSKSIQSSTSPFVGLNRSFSPRSGAFTNTSSATIPTTASTTSSFDLPGWQTTSSALAQLARLSSSLSLPGDSGSTTGKHSSQRDGITGLDVGSGKRPVSRPTTINGMTGNKRQRLFSSQHNAGPLSQVNLAGYTSDQRSKLPTETNNGFEVNERDREVSDRLGVPNFPIDPTNVAFAAFMQRLLAQDSLHQPAITQPCDNIAPPSVKPRLPTFNDSSPKNDPIDFSHQASSYSQQWTQCLQFLQQFIASMSSTSYNNKSPDLQQNNFMAYQLTRTFLDLFYSRMMVDGSSGSDNHNGLFHSSTSAPSVDFNKMSNKTPTPPPSSVTANTISDQQCLICGFKCSTHQELCYHIYFHLMSSSSTSSVKDNPSSTTQHNYSPNVVAQTHSHHSPTEVKKQSSIASDLGTSFLDWFAKLNSGQWSTTKGHEGERPVNFDSKSPPPLPSVNHYPSPAAMNNNGSGAPFFGGSTHGQHDAASFWSQYLLPSINSYLTTTTSFTPGF